MRIDSHHHFWNYSAEEYGWINDQMAELKRDFAPKDLKGLLDQNNLNGVISVQARQSVEETRWLLELADANEFILGVVGWLPLASPQVREQIEEWSHSEKLKAVRHVVQDEPDDAFILGADFNRGVAHLKDYGLVYDILIFAKHLKNSTKFVDQHPEQKFVLDHIAKPTISSTGFDEQWRKDLLELAKRENVTCKFSGVATEVRESSWDIEMIRPYWDTALEAFGADRLMHGSDWPVCLLKTEYGRWVEVVAELASSLSEAEQARFWGGTTREAYSC